MPNVVIFSCKGAYLTFPPLAAIYFPLSPRLGPDGNVNSVFLYISYMVLIISAVQTNTLKNLGRRDLPSCLSGGDLDGASKIY